MANCININHPEFLQMVRDSGLSRADLCAHMGIWMRNNNSENWPTLEQLNLNNKSIKEGVNFVFEQNPELANAVYEALGFDKQINEIADTKKVDEFIKKYKDALPNIKDGKTLISHLQTVSNRNTGTTKQFADLIIKLSKSNKGLEKLLNNPNLYAKPNSVGDEGAFHWSLFSKLSVNKIVLELDHFKTNTYDDVFLHELIHNLTTQFIVKDSNLFNQNFYNKVKELYSVFDNHLEANKKVNEPLLKSTKNDVKNLKRLKEYFEFLPSDAIQQELLFGKIGSLSTVKDVKLDYKSLENKSKQDVIKELERLLSFKESRIQEIEKGDKDYYYFNSKTFKQENVLSEFLATFMNDANFREQLKNIEYKNNKSIFQFIIDLISEFIGLTKNDSLYNEFVLNLTNFINNNDYSTIAEQTQKTAYQNRINLLEQQKQQAQQLYSQYLDTIFSDSEVKDIVYHGTDVNFDTFIKGFGKWSDAFWFDTKGTYKQKYQIKALINSKNPFSYNILQIDKIIESIYGQEQLNELHKYLINPSNRQLYVKEDEFEIEGETIISYAVYDTNGVLIKPVDTKEIGDKYVKNNSPKLSKVKQEVINLYENYTAEQHPDVEGGQFIKKEEIQKLQKAGFDSLIYNDYKAVFEPEQIHILGSKQDIGWFKKFVENKKSKQSNVFQKLIVLSKNTKDSISKAIDLLAKSSKRNDLILRELSKRLFNNTSYQILSSGELKERFSEFNESDIAFYDASSNTIFINSDNKLNSDDKEFSKTMMHEIVHAATVQRIKQLADKIANKTATKQEIELNDELNKVYSLAKLNLQDKFPQYFQEKNSLEEFVAGILDQDFLDELNKIEYNENANLSLKDRILSIIKQVLGINERTLAAAAFTNLFSLADIKNDEDFNPSEEIFKRTEGIEDLSEETQAIINKNEGLEVEMVTNEAGLRVQGEHYINPEGKLFNRITYGAKSLLKAFLPYTFKQNDDYAKSEADRRWGEYDHSTKFSIEGKLYTYDEYLENLRTINIRGTAKGNIIHALNELINATTAENISRLKAKVYSIEEENGISHGNYNWFTKSIKQIYETLGINKFNDNIPIELRDKIVCEVPISSELLGYGGSIDMLVEHNEKIRNYLGEEVGNMMSIYDLKSGYSVLNKLGSAILKYGEQTKYINNSPMDMAKLQVMLYAFMIKLENPNQQFRTLQVVAVANEYEATNKHNDSVVEVDAYLGMLEEFFKDKKLMKELEMEDNLYSKMIIQSPNLFTESHYRHSQFEKSDIATVEEINTKIACLQQSLHEIGISGNPRKEYEIEEKLIELNKQKLDLESDFNQIPFDQNKSNRTSFLAKWLGGLKDSNNPLVIAFRRAWEAAEVRVTKKQLAAADEIGEEMDALRREYYQSKGIVKSIEGDNLDMYKPLLKEAFVENVGSVERLIIESDEEWANLTQVQKNFILKHEEVMRRIFLEKDAYINKTASYDVNNKPKSHLKLQSPDFIYYPGFFAKTQPSKLDLQRRMGDGSVSAALLNPKYHKSMLADALSFNNENIFDKYDDDKIAIPIKYLGSKEWDSKRYYSYDIGTSLINFNSWIEYKKEMDAIYAVGKAATYQLQRGIRRDEDSRDIQREIDILNGFLRKNVRGISNTGEDWFAGKPPKIMTNPITGQPVYFLPQKFMSGLSNWGRQTTMYLKPWGATGNMVQQQWLLHRNGVNYSWAKKWFGDENSQTDYSLADAAQGDLAFAEIAKDMVLNNLHNNKIWRMMEMHNYIDGNSMKAIERRSKTLRERTTTSEAMMILHSTGELFSLVTTYVAQLNHMKLKDGRSFLEAYEIDESGEVAWTGGSRGKIKMLDGSYKELEGLDSNEISRFKRVHEKMMGSYRSDEFCGLELYAMGQFFLSLKKYFPRIVLNLFEGRKTDFYLGEYAKIGQYNIDGQDEDIYAWKGREIEGKFRSIIHAFSIAASFSTLRFEDAKQKWEQLNFEQKRNILEGMQTCAEWAALSILYSMVFGATPDDDARKKWFKMYMLDNLAQQYNPIDQLRTLSNVTPVGLAKAFKAGVGVSTMAFALMDLGMGDMEGAYTQKGDLRGWTEVQKSIPYYASYYDFFKKLSTISGPTDGQEKSWFEGWADMDYTKTK